MGQTHAAGGKAALGEWAQEIEITRPSPFLPFAGQSRAEPAHEP